MEYALGLVWNLQNKANGGGGEQDRNGVLRECACLSVRERGGGDMQYKLDCFLGGLFYQYLGCTTSPRGVG